MPSSRLLRCLILLPIALAGLSGSTVAAEQVEVRNLKQVLAPGDAEEVHVSLSFGNVTVEGTDGPNVEIELALDCNRADMEVCKARAERVRLAPRVGKRELKVRLKNTPRAWLRGIKARMKIRMPRHLRLEIDIKSGHLYVSGLEAKININSGAGDVDILGKRVHYRHVDVDIAFGKANLWLADSRVQGTGWPRKINWKGSGDHKIEIDVLGTGDVSVRLE